LANRAVEQLRGEKCETAVTCSTVHSFIKGAD
jgi:hypothetical protein